MHLIRWREWRKLSWFKTDRIISIIIISILLINLLQSMFTGEIKKAMTNILIAINKHHINKNHTLSFDSYSISNNRATWSGVLPLAHCENQTQACLSGSRRLAELREENERMGGPDETVQRGRHHYFFIRLNC